MVVPVGLKPDVVQIEAKYQIIKSVEILVLRQKVTICLRR